MNLQTADKYAASIANWVAPYCHAVHVAGSVRRRRQTCSDIDLVVIPKIETESDMFGHIVRRKNHLLEFLHAFVTMDVHATWRCTVGTSKEKPDATHNLMLKLRLCDLDVFIATEETLGSVLLCRTGSKEHNIHVAQMARERGLQWKTMVGIVDESGKVVAQNTEEQVLQAVGLGWIAPEMRERP